MGVSVRSVLMAGVASFGAVAIAVPGSVSAPVAERQVSVAPVALAAHAVPLPAPTTPTVFTRDDKAVALVVSNGSADVHLVPLAAAPGDVTTQNVASDAIIAAYQFIEYWVTYAVTDLTPYVLGF